MARPGFPKTIREFQLEFADEDACARYLASCRWPDGFRCPKCGHGRAYVLAVPRWQCAAPRSRTRRLADEALRGSRGVPLPHQPAKLMDAG